MPKPKSEVNHKIIRELQQALDYLGADPALADKRDLYQKLEALGADRELLAVFGSWGDTLDDEGVLVLLKEWNAAEGKAHRN
jgi:hypothetical protein